MKCEKAKLVPSSDVDPTMNNERVAGQVSFILTSEASELKV